MPDTTQLTLTLADVVTALQADPNLAPTRRRDLCSAVRRVAGMLARDPARLPASLPEIRRALAGINLALTVVSIALFGNMIREKVRPVGWPRPAAAGTPASVEIGVVR